MFVIKPSFLILCIIAIFLFQFTDDHFQYLNSFAEDVSINIKIDNTKYRSYDTVEITGYVENPLNDVLIITLFNADENVVLITQIKLIDDTFQISLPVSEIYEYSEFYVLTATISNVTAATTFEIIPDSQELPNTLPESSVVPVTSEQSISESEGIIFPKNINLINIFSKLYDEITLFLFIVISITIIFLIWIINSKKLLNIKIVKYQKQASITLDNPMPIQVKMINGMRISYDSWKTIPNDQKQNTASIEFWIKIKNNGDNVAKSISSRFFKEFKLFTRENLINKEIRPIPDLDSSDFYYYDFKITWDQFTKLKEHMFYVGLLISYTKQGTDNVSSGVIYGISMDKNYTLDQWIV